MGAKIAVTALLEVIVNVHGLVNRLAAALHAAAEPEPADQLLKSLKPKPVASSHSDVPLV